MSNACASGSGLLWRARGLGNGVTMEDWRLLAEDERGRAAAIGHRAARTRFVAGRALLRRSISELLPHLDARSHRLTVARSGRPWLAEHPDVAVSLSHTAGLVVAAVSRDGPVGIDVEPLGRSELPRADDWLTDEERRRLGALPPEARDARLLESWVAKEASLKACDHLGPISRRNIEIRGRRQDALEAITTAYGPSVTTDIISYHLHGGYLMAIATHRRPVARP
jgi:4'-phosphopantetheinyl transferase